MLRIHAIWRPGIQRPAALTGCIRVGPKVLYRKELRAFFGPDEGCEARGVAASPHPFQDFAYIRGGCLG